MPAAPYLPAMKLADSNMRNAAVQHKQSDERYPAALTGPQCRAARALLDWTRGKLARAAEVPVAAVIELESERVAFHRHVPAQIRLAFEDAGVELIEENGHGVGVKLRPR